MDPAIIVAIIALVASVFSATISVFGDVLLARWKAKTEAKLAVERFRGTLAEAAYELQSRLYNILRQDFLSYYHGEETEREYAIQNTIYAFAEYLAWVEALRREVEIGRLEEFQGRIADMTDQIARVLATDTLGDGFRMWRGEQEAVSDVMLKVEEGRVQSLSYAQFVNQRDEGFRKWFARLERDLVHLGEGRFENQRAFEGHIERLQPLQNQLIDLVRELDKTGRYEQAPMAKA
jgi:hypothetical protein